MLQGLRRDVLLASILALCLTGAWTSDQLLKVHDGVWNPDAGDPGFFARLCRSGSASGGGCAGAARSAWSQIKVPIPTFHRDPVTSIRTVGVPVAFVGLAYFLCLGVWFALLGGPRPIGVGWSRLVLAVAVCGEVASFLLLGLMALGQAPWCIGCVAVHVVNLLLVAAIWLLGMAPPGEPSGHESARPASRATLTAREAGTVVAIALVLVAGLYAHRRELLEVRDRSRHLQPYKDLVLSMQQDTEFLVGSYRTQTRRRIPARPRESETPRGHHQLVVFSDFECDACYHNTLALRDQVAKAFNGSLVVSVRHYPLCSRCNDQVKDTFHPNACRAAYAAEAARLQGGSRAFERMHDLLFANRKRLGDAVYRDLAVQVGLDPVLFLAQMEDSVVRQAVDGDIALARQLGVDGTPTLFLDGRRIPVLCMTPAFWQAVARFPVPSEESDEDPTLSRRSSGPFQESHLTPRAAVLPSRLLPASR